MYVCVCVCITTTQQKISWCRRVFPNLTKQLQLCGYITPTGSCPT